MSLDVNVGESNEINKYQIHQYIEQVAKLHKVEHFDYQVEYLCKTGDNFIANVIRVILTYKNNESDKKLSVIVKTLVNTIRQDLFYDIHEREVDSYKNVISKFKEILKSDCKENRITFADCLISETKSNIDVLVLEDLTTKGFKIENKYARYENVIYENIEFIIVQLAKFHALSIVFERQDPKLCKEVQSKFKDIIFDERFLNKTKLKDYFHDSFDKAVEVVDNLKARTQLERIEDNLLDILREFVKPRSFSVFCHGDLWMNNILLKHDDNGRLVKVAFIDFQAMRYANPVTDLMNFVYLCTDPEFRCLHLTELQDIYYESLSKTLQNYNIDLNQLYTKEEYEKDLKYYLPFGLLTALTEMRILTMTPEDEAVLSGSKIIGNMNEEVPGESKLFVARINDIIDEFIENGVLDATYSNNKRRGSYFY